MADESFQEKTEQPTSKRKEDVRKKGQVAKSMEVNSAFVLLFGLLILYFGGMALYSGISGTYREIFMNMFSVDFSINGIQKLFMNLVMNVGVILFLIMLSLMIVGMIGSYAQVGFLFTIEPLIPKFEKLDPLKGIKRIIISKRSLLELLKGILKIIIIGLIGWYSIASYMNDTFLLMDSDVYTIFLFLCKAAISISFKIGMVLLMLALIDYLIQRRIHQKEIRMTKDEVKEEMKQLEGDPLIKSRIRSIQRQLSRKRMMAEVPKAAVVITNPTHLAIALKYKIGVKEAPKVIAKGADLIAEKIKSIAKEHNIPIVENKPLAQLIFKSVKVDEEIPESLYQAVAQVLAYIFKLKNVNTSKIKL
jgi:flagellar biosynthesis protein FlhB